MSYHIPVLLQESVSGLQVKHDGVYVDATFGGGGHSGEILKYLKTGRLVAFDQDPDAKANQIQNERFLFIPHNFRYLKNFLKWHGVDCIDGLLADLGVSSHHLDDPSRGFSYRYDAELDMRMNPAAQGSARDILMTRTEEDLRIIFRRYGELPNAAMLAGKIVRYRGSGNIQTVGDLTRALSGALPKTQQAKYLSKLFQALRIEVNHEMECLEELLMQCVELVKPGGRLVVITYHSLEDRMVKNFIRSGNMDGIIDKDLYGNYRVPFEQVNRKVIVPGKDELKTNRRARSAKLRIAERTSTKDERGE